jgi:hypothetical protein
MRSYLEEIVAASVKKTEIAAIEIRRADHATSSILKLLELTLPTSGGRSDCIVRSPTKATELYIYLYLVLISEMVGIKWLDSRFDCFTPGVYWI